MQIQLELTLNKADKYNKLYNYLIVCLPTEILLNGTRKYKLILECISYSTICLPIFLSI